MSSIASSSRQRPAPLRTIDSPTRKAQILASAATASDSLPTSKSQQLALAVAAAAAAADMAANPASSQFRPDSLWSERGADVVWSGKSQLANGLPSPALPSPGVQSTMNASTEESQGEFADADEGTDSDEMHSASADDTTQTTISTSATSGRKFAHLATQSTNLPLGLAKTNVNAAPKRPQRKAPRLPLASDDSQYVEYANGFGDAVNPHYGNDGEIDVDGNSHFGHSRNVSIGSSIWAGRGAKSSHNKENLNAHPPVPAVPDSMLSPNLDAGRASFAETSSLYSQGGATPDLGEHIQSTPFGVTSETQRLLEQTPPLDRLRNMTSAPSPSAQSGKEDEFEMMDTRSIYSGKVRSSVTSSTAAAEGDQSQQRRLPDGTVVPKMPPMPTDPFSMFTPDPAASKTRTRAQRGRRNRSPVLSYADGEEEERRMVQESEMREHGGVEFLPTSSSLGPRLKKNSPAPWEMDDEMDFNRVQQDTLTGMPAARPSADNLLSASGIKNPSQWARQSMEQFRSRSTSDKGHSPNIPSLPSSATAKMPAFPSSASQHGLSPLANSAEYGSSSRSVSGGSNAATLAVEEVTPVRRSRTKSVSGSAAGVLKGLGLASSSMGNAPTKKASSSRLAKAFRSSSKTNTAGPAVESSAGRKASAVNLSRGISSDDYSLMPSSPLTQNGSNLLVGGQSPYLGQSSATSHSSLSHRSDTPGEGGAYRGPSDLPSPPPMPKRTASVGISPSQQGAVPNVSVDGHSLGSSTSGTKAGGEMQARNMAALSVGSSADTTGDSSSPHTPLLSTVARVEGLSPSKASVRSSPPYSSKQMHVSGSETERAPVDSGHRSHDTQRSAELAAKQQMSVGNVHLAAPDAASSAMSRVPSVGALEGVPYKLISLEEARQQHHQQQQKQSHHDVADAATGGDVDRTLKGKKSGGFLRRFGKERLDQPPMPNGPDGFGALPSFGPSIQLQQAQQRENAAAAPPTLSVRPMSSIFTGLASNLIDPNTFDSASATESTRIGNGQLSPTSPSHLGIPSHQSSARSGLAPPHSPAITVASVESNPSAGDYYDALERSSQAENGAGAKNGHAPGFDLRNLSAGVALSARRASSESARSDGSSALGLVNGFPALPATGHGAIAASLTSKAAAGANGELPSLASATRQRALEIEAKMAELHGELIKLRVFAVDSGLTLRSNPGSSFNSPNPGGADGGEEHDAMEEMISSPATPALTASSGGVRDEDEAAAAAANSLNTPIPPCHQCGCSCADQKRVLALNELSVLKGISVLERGRALKSIAGQNGSKFGGYLDR